VIEAVVFDLDGLLIETEELWDEVREALAHERGGRWSDSAQKDMMGMSSTEWSRYMHETIGLAEPPEEINDLVVERMAERYRSGLPLLRAPSKPSSGLRPAGRSGSPRRRTAS
jgi:beta-phosphoglucomutase-like phosphatase (HAD superfamily)